MCISVEGFLIVSFTSRVGVFGGTHPVLVFVALFALFALFVLFVLFLFRSTECLL